MKALKLAGVAIAAVIVVIALLLVIGEALGASRDDVVLDAGCGDGFYLGSLAQQIGFHAHGVDISIPAIDAAARRYPQCHQAL